MNVPKKLVPGATTLQPTCVDPSPQPQGQLSIERERLRTFLPRHLETFQRVDLTTRDTSLERKQNNPLALKDMWDWAMCKTAPVSHGAYAQLLAENNALREDNDRLREALAQANHQGSSSQKSLATLSDDIGLIVRELIDPLLKK